MARTAGNTFQEHGTTNEYYSFSELEAEMAQVLTYSSSGSDAEARVEDNEPMNCTAENIDQFLLDIGLARFERSKGRFSSLKFFYITHIIYSFLRSISQPRDLNPPNER